MSNEISIKVMSTYWLNSDYQKNRARLRDIKIRPSLLSLVGQWRQPLKKNELAIYYELLFTFSLISLSYKEYFCYNWIISFILCFEVTLPIKKASLCLPTQTCNSKCCWNYIITSNSLVLHLYLPHLIFP